MCIRDRNYVSWKRRPEVAADLKRIYTCATAEEAEQRLTEFEARWDAEYLPIGQSWRRNWVRLIPFFDYPPEIRKVIYTTNAIEAVNMGLRTLTKHRGAFPSDEALIKLLYLAQMCIRDSLKGAHDEVLLAATAQNLRRMAAWLMPKGQEAGIAIPI